jgi:tRNA(Ile)-lysidine synthetase-like protein
VAEEQIAYLDDPMNTDRRLLRARVRHDLLPMLAAAQPAFATEWLALGERAAQWRRDVDRFLEQQGLVVSADGRQALMPSHLLDESTPEARAVLWPAICARAGVTLDATGTHAAVRFTTTRRRGAQLPLAGGALLLRRREGAHEVFEVRRRAPAGPAVEWRGTSDALPPRFGRWRFRRLADAALPSGGDRRLDPWVMALPAGKPVVVRVWAAGDRIVTVGAPAGRRVTRYFSESRVPVPDRPSWPVVLIDDVPAWVPGVCCAAAAPSRPGRSDLIWYRCERERD